jgi:hypothetical protein
VASSFPRIFALVFDGMWSYVLLTLFAPYQFFDVIVTKLSNAFTAFVLTFYTVLLEDQVERYIMADADWVNNVKSAWDFISSEFNIIPFLSMYFFIRLIGTAFLGVSPGSYMLGLKTQGTKWWSRLRGTLREILSWFTTPFIIPELPNMVGVKSLKEIVTAAPVKSPILWKMMLRLSFFAPIMLLLVLTVPFFSGLEMRKGKDIPMAKPVAGLGESLELSQLQGSKYLNLVYPKIDDYLYLPEFSLTMSGKKKSIIPKLNVYSRTSKEQFSIYKSSSFSWRKVIQEAGRGDFLFQQNYPQLYAYAWDAAHYSAVFRSKMDQSQMQEFYDEFSALTATGLGLTLNNLYQHIQIKGPFFQGLFDFRESIEALFGKYERVEFVKLGKQHFFVIQLDKKNLKLIPVNREKEVSTYMVTSNTKIDSVAIKQFFANTEFYQGSSLVKKIEKFTAGQSLDYFSGDSSILKNTMFEYLFGFYFREAGGALEMDNSELQAVLLKRVDELIRLLKTRNNKKVETSNTIYQEVLPEDKLIQRLNEIIKAIVDKDLAYFGIKRLG